MNTWRPAPLGKNTRQAGFRQVLVAVAAHSARRRRSSHEVFACHMPLSHGIASACPNHIHLRRLQREYHQISGGGLTLTSTNAGNFVGCRASQGKQSGKIILRGDGQPRASRDCLGRCGRRRRDEPAQCVVDNRRGGGGWQQHAGRRHAVGRQHILEQRRRDGRRVGRIREDDRSKPSISTPIPGSTGSRRT